MDKLLKVYKSLQLEITHGEGAWLYSGRQKILDLFAGIAVTNLGHMHPEITDAITDLAQKVLHHSNLFVSTNAKVLAEKIVKHAKMDGEVFFSNSGSESVECLIKLARLYGHSRKISEPKILVFTKAFHGRSMAGLTACANPKYQDGYAPLVPGFVRAPYGDIDAITAMLNSDLNICAVMLEPVQGEAGVHLLPPLFLQQLEALCRSKKALLLLDEVQTGIGRTGHMYAYLADNIKPDAFALAKALGNGIPIGATFIQAKHTKLFQPGSHGSTFGGNPFATGVASKVLDCISDDLLQNVRSKGEYFLDALTQDLLPHHFVNEVRGVGLMLAIELNVAARPVLPFLLQENIICITSGEMILRLLPPLIISYAEIDFAVLAFVRALTNYAVHLSEDKLTENTLSL